MNTVKKIYLYELEAEVGAGEPVLREFNASNDAEAIEKAKLLAKKHKAPLATVAEKNGGEEFVNHKGVTCRVHRVVAYGYGTTFCVPDNALWMPPGVPCPSVGDGCEARFAWQFDNVGVGLCCPLYFGKAGWEEVKPVEQLLGNHVQSTGFAPEKLQVFRCPACQTKLLVIDESDNWLEHNAWKEVDWEQPGLDRVAGE